MTMLYRKGVFYARIMKIVSIQSLAVPDIRLIRFARFRDHRGYFTESFRKDDFERTDFLRGTAFPQVNESFSQSGTLRGLHFQWDPRMGKLIRTLSGRMVDLVMDIRKGSPYFGKLIACDMPSRQEFDYGEWIWVPSGFAHGNYFTEPTTIQYFCSGTYNPQCESGISPLAADLDLSLCDPALKEEFESFRANDPLMTEKDRNAHTLESWRRTADSNAFLFSGPSS